MIRAMRSFVFVFAFLTVLPLAAAAPVQTYSGGAASTYGPIEYDPSGNVIAVGSSTSATNEYVYDPGSRIVLAAVQRAGNLHQQSYTYDAYGNLLATNSAGGLLARQVDAATNRLGNGAPLHAEYDAAGNLTAWIPPNQASTRNYHYDAMNALVRESGTGLGGTAFVYHAYTAGDERFWTETVPPGATAKNIVASYTIRDLAGQVLREYRSHPCIAPCDPIRVEREYAYRAGQLLGASTPAAKHYYTLDHLGTPRLVTDQGRNLVAEHNYFPFGLEITDNAPTDGPLRFTGHERDADVLGHSAGMLDYMHARYYSAMGGRFLSVDPGKDWDLHQPQSWNMYAYVQNNPVNATDPTGRNVYRTTWRILKYVGQEGKVIARVTENSKNKALKRITAALDSIDTRGGAHRVLIAENAESRDVVARQLSDSGKIRGPERSGIYPEHVQAADGKYSDVHVQTVDDTKAAGFGKGLLSIVAPTSMTAGASEDATAGEIASAAIWDVAKAIDPLFVTDIIERATGLDDYEEERVRDTPPRP